VESLIIPPEEASNWGVSDIPKKLLKKIEDLKNKEHFTYYKSMFYTKSPEYADTDILRSPD
jgi:hypothetical protein